MTESRPRADEAPETNAPSSLCSKLAARLQALRYCTNRPKQAFASLPRPSQERLDTSLTDAAFDTRQLASSSTLPADTHKTVLYLAYGSNLCKETFRGSRGIRPLSQLNVVVPSLRLTFDLPGVPYTEPCFANTARRSSDTRAQRIDYHKNRWHKGLVGVVYEVTLADYAHIIATEGGGSAYHDILVDCYALPDCDTVPSSPASTPFKAHTLFAPTQDSNGNTQSTDRLTRPDPSYAQPSARYLKLITDGAAECALPTEYQDYLRDIRAYTVTSKRQMAGKAVFLALWMPFLLLVFTLSRQLQDKKGRAPSWLGQLTAMLFAAMWRSYDKAFRIVFGDGERTTGQGAILQRTASFTDPIMDKQGTEKQRLLEGAACITYGHTGSEQESSRKWRDIV
ncbi:hypothetical protein BKA66DRAFT_429303 [Pyrenochaeta sp. MPI-SDFR-AT-0127]|nr:hypothetical protein BKA66DRAFT_429303 [Pyrenochaeta sp. MPI-SDFR-AT-0127]